jgi:hypothetical protein
MTTELQNFYLYLKQQERNAKTMQSHFKEAYKTAKWFKEWEKHYKECASTLLHYCQQRRNITELDAVKITGEE